MDKKKLDLGGAAALIDNAKYKLIKAIDLNNDGEFNAKDIAVIGDSVKNVAVNIKAAADNAQREAEIKALMPVFSDDIFSAEFMMPKLIRIADKDKKHSDYKVCDNSIGHFSAYEHIKMLNIYPKAIDEYEINFYPDFDSDIYYVDPCDRDRYIALCDYYTTLKMSRVAELSRIAQDLGAKYFKLTIKERKKTIRQVDIKAKGKAAKQQLEAEHSATESDSETVEIAAESRYQGHEPFHPELHYLKNDITVNSLIARRLDKNAPLSYEKLRIEFSTSSGLKEKDALRIASVLKGLKIDFNGKFIEEAQREERLFFEYEIEF